ncbi:MAG: hypothetical protein H7X79_08550 [Sporomusaceae bacterium]|nr:hypothetical protein [Sporomusaceae bacterium]
MVTKVSRVYRVDIQKHDQRQAKDRSKKKEQEKFKDTLAKVLISKRI